MAGLLNLNTDSLQNSQLSALQKVDSSIVAILTSSPHVAIYIFPKGAQQWQRKNIEGPLYLVRRSSLPQFSFVILNRKGNQHMIEMISTSFEFQNQDPYIIFRNSKAQNPLPHGMWFKSTEDRERVWKQFETIKDTLARRNHGGNGGQQQSNPNQQQQQQQQQQRQLQQRQQQLQQQQQQQRQQNQQNLRGAPVQQIQQMNVQGMTSDQVELSKVQLQKILIGMMKSDKFVDMLHKQYLGALRKRRAAASQGK